MRLEDLKSALEPAREAVRASQKLCTALRDEIEAIRRRRSELEKEPQRASAAEYLESAGRLYGKLIEQRELLARHKPLEALERALRGLPHDWIAAMPGCGLFCVHFFVRNFRIEEGKPAAVEPFWIESCAERPAEKLELLLGLHARWLSGTLRPDGPGPADPLMPLRHPFGPVEEAAVSRCACGADGYVIGYTELGHWTEDDDWPYRQSLDLLCLACAKLTPLAERSDLPRAKLFDRP